nr:trypsin-like serine protease [Lysinibacillus timonensis]
MKKSILTILLIVFMLIPINVFAKDANMNIELGKKVEINYIDDNELRHAPFSSETESFRGTGDTIPVKLDELLGNTLSKNQLTEGNISPFLVIGPDNRTRVADTTAYPFRTIGYLSLLFEDNTGASCTGTLIGTNKVLTNAHCTFNNRTGSPLVAALFIPGVGNNTAYYGGYAVTNVFVPESYDNDVANDYSVFILDKNNNMDAGERVGYLSIKRISSLLNQEIGIFGYPGDLINTNPDFGIHQYGMRGNVFEETTNVARYHIDTAGGQSGSALLNESNQVVGIHSSGISELVSQQPLYNAGPKMNSDMYTFVYSVLRNH